MKRKHSLLSMMIIAFILSGCAAQIPAWRVHNQQAFVLLNEKKFDEAITEYSKAIELLPTAPFLYSSRARVYRLKRDNTHAIADFTKALEIEPNAFEVYFERGNLFAAGMQFEKAINDYTKAIEKTPDSRYYLNRGLIYMLQKKYDPAKADFEKVINDAPRTHVAHYNLGLIHTYQDNLDKAVGALSQAIKFNKDYVDAFVARGDAYLKLGKTDLSKYDYQKACDLGRLDICDELKQKP
jgi:tetratricopeptide (TPR) repeat protein